MLEIVSRGFKNAKAALLGRTELTAENIDAAVREIRVSLLEADVETGVVKRFIERVKSRAIGEVVELSAKKNGQKLRATPGEHFIAICQDELVKLMGPIEEKPIVYKKPVTTVMMVGLQGVGKTTTCGKLAHYFLQQKRRPLLVAADIYRPAAVEQLKILGSQLGAPVYHDAALAPPDLCANAKSIAKQNNCDVIIFDTAGRLAIDEALMGELDAIKARTQPDNIFLVCDAMAGQDTVQTAGEFNRRLQITGFVMTKLDGDARGGAALSIKDITGKPIKFLGMGEGLDKLEPFRAEGLASRILGMGDVVGLMKDFEQVIDEKQAEREAKKLLKGQFNFEDFLNQLRMIQKVGSLKDIYEKFPIFGDDLPEGANLDDGQFKVMESIIQSMTKAERQNGKLIDASRKQRIARGAGRNVEQVTELVDKFSMMHTMMSNIGKQPGLLGMLPGVKQLAGLRNLKNMDLGSMLGGGLKMPAGMQMPSMDELPPGMLPPGVTQEQYAQAMQAYQRMQGGAVPSVIKPLDQKTRDKLKQKRKQQKLARKRARR
jgi:signal recognition particle subunit SRP54